MLKLAGWLSAVAVVAGAVLGAPAAATADPVVTAPRPDVVGHRGAGGVVPENTLPAFAAGISTGVDRLELDVRYTRDHVLVVYHDPVLRHRQCLGPYVGMRIADLTYAQVEANDCGYPSISGADRVEPTAIATLGQVYDFLDHNGDTTTQVQVEVKDAPGDESGTIADFLSDIAGLLQTYQAQGRTSLSSERWDVLRQAAADPRFTGVPLVAIGSARSLGLGTPGVAPLPGVDINAAPYDGDVAAAARDAGATSLALNYADDYVTGEFVGHAHALGLKVGVWTVDDPATMSRVLAEGVDAITTDYPDQLRIAEQADGWSPPAADTVTDPPAAAAVPAWAPVPTSVVATSGAVSHHLYARRTGERYYRDLGGHLIGPAAVVAAGGRDYFVGVGAQRRLYVRTYDTGWTVLSGSHVACAQPAAAVAGGRLAVACMGYGDRNLHYATAALPATGNPVLQLWRNLGGRLHSGPALYTDGEGTLHLLAIGSSSGAVYQRTPASPWTPAGLACTGQPDALASGALTFVACRDAGGHLQYRSNGTTKQTDISAVSRVGLADGGSDRVVAYGEAPTGQVWQTLLNNRYAAPPTRYDGNIAGGVTADTA